MQPRTIAILGFLVATISAFSESYAGAKLYCVNANKLNANNTKIWLWAHWNDSDDNVTWIAKEKSPTYGAYGQNYLGKVWLEGRVESASLNLRPVAPGKSKEYCKRLVQICQNEYGLDYRYVGAAYSEATIAWLGIIIPEELQWGQEQEKFQECPNWKVDGAKLDEGGKYHVVCVDPQRPKAVFSQIPLPNRLYAWGAWLDGKTKIYPAGVAVDASDRDSMNRSLLLSSLYRNVAEQYCQGS